MLARAEVLRDERRNITGCLLSSAIGVQKTPITAIAAPSASRRPGSKVDAVNGQLQIPEAIGDDKRPGNSEDLLPALRGMKFSVPWGVS